MKHLDTNKSGRLRIAADFMFLNVISTWTRIYTTDRPFREINSNTREIRMLISRTWDRSKVYRNLNSS